MDFQFLIPKMNLKEIIKSPNILKYCKEFGSVTLYNYLIENNLIKEDLNDLNEIKIKYEKRLNKIEKETENYDNFKKVLTFSNFYAETINLTEFDKLLNENITENSIKMDALLYKIRINFIFNDLKEIEKLILEAEDLQNKCDWDRKNKFMISNGLLNLIKGNFKLSSNCFFESLATFNAYEIMDYETIGVYAIYSGILSMKQKEFKKSIINLTELIEMQGKIENTYNLAISYSNCDYKTIYSNLNKFIKENKEEEFLKNHIILFEKTVKFNLLEIVLNSYSNIKITKMADLFNVSINIMEMDLVNLIENRKLNFKIDGVNGLIKFID